MNSDEIMSDPAGPMHTPKSNSQQQRQQLHPSRGPRATASEWSTQKWRDESEIYKNRLKHLRFSVADYPDPLASWLPHPDQYPKGTDPELERRLHRLIAEVKAGRGGNGIAA